jgi:hypothetical protein
LNKTNLAIIIGFSTLLLIFGQFNNELLTENYKEILTASLAFIGTVIALIFTLIALPIQNILGKYSQDLVQKITEDKELKLYLIISLIFFAFNFSIFLVYNWAFIIPFTKIEFKLIVFSYTFTIVYLIILILYVNRVYYLLDTRNAIKKVSDNIKIRINDSCTENPFEWLENETELIFDIVQKAILENRYEIVDSGFEEIKEITIIYILINKPNLITKMDDKFLTHILNNLINSKSIISPNSHPKIMKSLMNCTGDIAEETTDIEIINMLNIDYFTPGFIRLLGDIILGNAMIEETSNMPAEASDKLLEIGKKAIDSNNISVVKKIIKILCEANRIATQMHFLRGDVIAHYINHNLAELLVYSLKNSDKILYDEIHFFLDIIQEIGENIRIYSEDNHQHSDININTLTGPIAKYSISVIAHLIMEKITDDSFEEVCLLKEIINILDYNLEATIKTEKYSSTNQLLDNIYTIGIGLINLLNRINDKKLDETTLKLLSHILNILYYKMSDYLKTDAPFFEAITLYFSFIGFLLVKDEQKKFLNEIIKNILNLMDIFSLIGDNSRLLYPYIRLIGVWNNRFINDSTLFFRIEEIVKEQDKFLEDIEIKAIKTIHSKKERSYPSMALKKSLKKPIFPYDLNYLGPEEEILFRDEDIDKFEEFFEDD